MERTPEHADRIVGLYERHARAYAHGRSDSLQERAWLDRFLAHVRPGGVVLDLGCGGGEPVARYVVDRGLGVFGVDASPSMIELFRERLPGAEWRVGDMRTLALGRRFAGILAWDSFFHLDRDAQRRMFPRFAAHAEDGAPLMFSSGPREGEAIGSFQGEPLYHASLGAPEYEDLLAANGFRVDAHAAEDPECGDHTVWLAVYGG